MSGEQHDSAGKVFSHGGWPIAAAITSAWSIEGYDVEPRVNNGPALAGHGTEDVRDAIATLPKQTPSHPDLGASLAPPRADPRLGTRHPPPGPAQRLLQDRSASGRLQGPGHATRPCPHPAASATDHRDQRADRRTDHNARTTHSDAAGRRRLRTADRGEAESVRPPASTDSKAATPTPATTASPTTRVVVQPRTPPPQPR